MKRHISAASARTLPLLAAAAAALTFAACDDVILASVQEERKVAGSDYFKNARVSGVEKSGSTLVASTLRLYHKSGEAAWQPASGFSGDAVGLARTGTAFYAASSDGKIYTSGDGAAWTAHATSPAGAVVEGVFDANGSVFAAIKSGTGHALYDVTAGFGAALIAGQDEHFVGVVHDGTNYWAATTKKLYMGWADQGFSLGSKTISALGVFGVFGGTVQIAVFDGSNATLYNGPGDASPSLVKSGEASVEVSAILGAPKGGGQELVLLGTAAASSSIVGKGYLEAADASYGTVLAGGAAGAILANPLPTNFDTTLAGKSIVGFDYVGTAGSGTLYARTYSAGLWSNAWNGTAWAGWTAE